VSASHKADADGVAAMRRVFDTVLAQMRKDADFAQRISAALAGEPLRRGGGRRSPAVLDPLVLWRDDPAALERRLRELDVEQLKDIVSHYGLDPSRLALKWKTADRLIKLIMETSEARARKGEAFRAPSAQSA
jgi:hypothetical protein